MMRFVSVLLVVLSCAAAVSCVRGDGRAPPSVEDPIVGYLEIRRAASDQPGEGVDFERPLGGAIRLGPPTWFPLSRISTQSKEVHRRGSLDSAYETIRVIELGLEIHQSARAEYVAMLDEADEPGGLRLGFLAGGHLVHEMIFLDKPVSDPALRGQSDDFTAGRAADIVHRLGTAVPPEGATVAGRD